MKTKILSAILLLATTATPFFANAQNAAKPKTKLTWITSMVTSKFAISCKAKVIINSNGKYEFNYPFTRTDTDTTRQSWLLAVLVTSPASPNIYLMGEKSEMADTVKVDEHHMSAYFQPLEKDWSNMLTGAKLYWKFYKKQSESDPKTILDIANEIITAPKYAALGLDKKTLQKLSW